MDGASFSGRLVGDDKGNCHLDAPYYWLCPVTSLLCQLHSPKANQHIKAVHTHGFFLKNCNFTHAMLFFQGHLVKSLEFTCVKRPFF
jgi:hypothetical protein